MELVLDVVLEHADIETLLDCVFMSKHVHATVMRILAPEFRLLDKMDDTFYGEVYEGIQFIGSYLQHQDNYTGGCMEFVRELIVMSRQMRKRLMAIYAKLYPFWIFHKRAYRYGRHNIFSGGMYKPVAFMADFAPYIDRYYYKMTCEVVGNLIYGAFKFEKYEWVIKRILDKGFNIDSLLYIGNKKTTVLLYAAQKERLEIINLLLDYRPNLYLYDSSGACGAKALKQYINIGRDARCDVWRDARREYKDILMKIGVKYHILVPEQRELRNTRLWNIAST